VTRLGFGRTTSFHRQGCHVSQALPAALGCHLLSCPADLGCRAPFLKSAIPRRRAALRSYQPTNRPKSSTINIGAIPLSSDRSPQLFCDVIPEIDIWRAANLMLKRYGAKAEGEADAIVAETPRNGVSWF
jgi:hypothetical protein